MSAGQTASSSPFISTFFQSLGMWKKDRLVKERQNKWCSNRKKWWSRRKRSENEWFSTGWIFPIWPNRTKTMTDWAKNFFYFLWWNGSKNYSQRSPLPDNAFRATVESFDGTQIRSAGGQKMPKIGRIINSIHARPAKNNLTKQTNKREEKEKFYYNSISWTMTRLCWGVFSSASDLFLSWSHKLSPAKVLDFANPVSTS